MSIYVRELGGPYHNPPPVIKFVGMIGYSPASFHDLFSDDDLPSEDSSIGEVSSPGCPALR
jgi:hypothetical protein